MSRPSKLYESLNPRSDGVVTFTTRADAPPGAVLLDRNEAIKHQMDLYAHWKPKTDVWPITCGAVISGAAASFGGIMLNAIFRKHFKLRNTGMLSTAAPNIVLPGVFAFLTSVKTIQDLIIMDTQCAVCTQMEVMCWQLASGAVYPCTMAPLACINIAMRTFTYPVLPFRTHYKEILSEILRVLQKHRVKIGGLVAFQCILAFTLQHMQMRSVLKVHRKIAEH